MSLMKCERCARILAERLYDGSVFARQRGREIYATDVTRIRCEQCRHTTVFRPRGSAAPSPARSQASARA